MPRAKVSKAVVITLLAVLIFAVIGGAITVSWVVMREEEFKRDKERYKELNQAIDVEIKIHDSEYRPRANKFITEQNAILRKWPGRFPGRAEQQLLGSPDP